MRKNKKNALGVLSALTIGIMPIAAVVSCGNQETKKQKIITYERFYIARDEHPSDSFVLLKEQNAKLENFRDIIMENGRLRDADDVSDKKLEAFKTITLDMTYSDALKAKIIQKMAKLKSEYKEVQAGAKISTMIEKKFTSTFFETLTTKENAIKWAKKLNDLYAQKKFYLGFNLILPKELSEYKLGVSIWMNGIAKLASIKKMNKNININGMYLGETTAGLKISTLPKELKFLDVSGSDEFPFSDNWVEFNKLPKNLKYIDIYSSKLSRTKKGEIKNYAKKHEPNKKLSSLNQTDPNTIDNPEARQMD